MEPLIELHQVTVYRGQTKVFDDLTLVVPSGQQTAILGPNGAGKSTFLKLITREIYPAVRPGSTVRLLGRERWNVWALRRHLGIISHELQRAYPDHVLGLDVVLSGFYWSTGTWPHQVFDEAQRQRAWELMALFGVEALARVPFGQMSAGEQRRCLLARALVHDPDVLILDEPTNGLDLAARFAFLEMVRRLIVQGKTVIFVTHRVDEIVPEVAHVVLLKDGRVLAAGSKAEMLTDERLSALFDVPLTVLQANGYYQVVPRGAALSHLAGGEEG